MEVKSIEEFENWTDDDWSVYVDEVNIDYCQKGDSVDSDPKHIEISAVNNGVARFIRIKTGENGWSFTDEDELIELINDFKKRAEL